MKKTALAITLCGIYGFSIAKPIPENERITALMEGKQEITSLVHIQNRGLNIGATALDLWSGSYWPQYQGSLGVRYRDPSFIGLMKAQEQFPKFKELKEKRPLYSYYGMENLLSPSEKYDMLVGDSEMSLTKYAWELGEKNGGALGNVPIWRGICDGWSSASQMMPRPAKSVTLKTAQGTSITFYPEDIKALGSLLYARAQENVIFLGKRCYPVVGVITGACDGTNPGAFHKALVNRIGMLKKSLNADTSATSQVWNYPVKSYKMSFYNVFTDEESTDFKEAYEIFEKKHRFSKSGRRHEKTYAIVGVKAEVSFTDMRAANLLETDSAESDKVLTNTYYYDLELDRNFNILGGEWFGPMPDFIWAPNDRTYPISDGEKKLNPKTASELVAASRISAKVGQPLAVIVEKLFELSK